MDAAFRRTEDESVGGNEIATIRLTEPDGTCCELDIGNTSNHQARIRPELGGPASWRNNEGLSSTRGHDGQQGNHSDGQTEINDHGDTAQLEVETKKSKSEALRSSEDDLSHVGGAPGLDDQAPVIGDPTIDISEPESEPVCDNLWFLIDEQLIEPPPENGKKYLPLDQLRKLMVKPKVRQALKKLEGLDQETIYRYANEVCDTTKYGDIQKTTRHKIFAILVRIEQVEALPSFIDEGLHDVHLPFTLEKGPKWHLTYTTTDKATAQKITAKYKGSYSWTMAKMSLFVENQWLFMAPFFDMKATKPPFYPLEPRVVLPFLKEEKYDASYGGFSTVSRAHIHKAHHNSEHLHSGNRSDFEQERHAMKKLNGQGHPHLMKLLATYKYQDHWYFIFPWANGNLREFWQRYDTPKADYGLAVWIAEQITGIASGLYLIQHPPKDLALTQDARDSGRHGDLKPENVLWFKGPGIDESVIGNGVLKIADFGLTRYHHHSSRYVKAQDIQFSLTYKAPEVDVSEEVSQAYDIWTLGCLLLEFVTWYLGGWQAVDEFSADRTSDDLQEIRMDTFYNITVETDAVKRAVLKLALHNHEKCSLYFHELLDYISDHLLRIDTKKRQKCIDVRKRLGEMARRCNDDQVYAVRGCTEPHRTVGIMKTARTDEAATDYRCTETEYDSQATLVGSRSSSPERTNEIESRGGVSKRRNANSAGFEDFIPEVVIVVFAVLFYASVFLQRRKGA
ncbi:kinase-like protein [Colletotrichum falcatum]|nr:kinase-like protein [Colletotrichum falcatum]